MRRSTAAGESATGLVAAGLAEPHRSHMCRWFYDFSPKMHRAWPSCSSATQNCDGKVVVAFKDSGKFNTRSSTLEFQDPAALDEGDMWPCRPPSSTGAAAPAALGGRPSGS